MSIEKNEIYNKKPLCPAYAAISLEDKVLKESASGGVFAVIAAEVLSKGGVVYGCSMEKENNNLFPVHIDIYSINDLHKLQGSKYVQSNMEKVYKTIKDNLQRRKVVLFSGTSCQVAGIESFLQNEDTSNLYTISIICHGVPNSKIFVDYISLLEKRLKGEITKFTFRDKSLTWNLDSRIHYIAKAEYNNRKGKRKIQYIPSNVSSYYSFFLESEILNEQCYNCQFVNNQLKGDIIIGDYWGFGNEHPEYLIENGGKIDAKKGVSCIIVNTVKGEQLLKEYSYGLIKCETTINSITNENKQLLSPSRFSEKRKTIMDLYSKSGYSAVEKFFRKELGLKYYYRWLKFLLFKRKKIKNDTQK